MKASIIIGSYNHKEVTLECIECCLKQDFDGEYEIIVVDDGSDDSSIELIEEYASKHPQKIKCAVMDRNDGVDIVGFRISHVKEKGVSLSSGEYLLLLDGDDLISENKLSMQIGFLEKHKEYIACFTDFEWFWPDGRKQEQLFPYVSVSNKYYWGNCYMHISCFVFRREVVKNFIHSCVNDNLATFSVLKTGKIYHLSGVTFFYRQREKSVYHSFDSFEKKLREAFYSQFILSTGGMRFSTLAKYGATIRHIYKNRKQLSEDRFQKYFKYTDELKRDYLYEFRDYDTLSALKKLSIKGFLAEVFFARAFNRIRRTTQRIIHRKNS